MYYFSPRDLGHWSLINTYIGNYNMGSKNADAPNQMKYKSASSFTNPSSNIFPLFFIFSNIYYLRIYYTIY